MTDSTNRVLIAVMIIIGIIAIVLLFTQGFFGIPNLSVGYDNCACRTVATASFRDETVQWNHSDDTIPVMHIARTDSSNSSSTVTTTTTTYSSSESAAPVVAPAPVSPTYYPPTYQQPTYYQNNNTYPYNNNNYPYNNTAAYNPNTYNYNNNGYNNNYNYSNGTQY